MVRTPVQRNNEWSLQSCTVPTLYRCVFVTPIPFQHCTDVHSLPQYRSSTTGVHSLPQLPFQSVTFLKYEWNVTLHNVSWDTRRHVTHSASLWTRLCCLVIYLDPCPAYPLAWTTGHPHATPSGVSRLRLWGAGGNCLTCCLLTGA